MRKIYRSKKIKGPPTGYRINERILAPQIKLIDENGEMMGVVSTNEALKTAQERGLDLVEISPIAVPPVAKIMDYGSFKYKLEKRIQKQKAKQKKIETKGIRLSLGISEHDREVKFNQAKKFIDQGDKLKIELPLKGREHQHTNLAREQIFKFIDDLKKEPGYNIIVEQPLAKAGGKLIMIIYNKK